MLLPESHVFRGGTFVWVGDLSRSIQLLHLDQAWVEDFISNLTDGHFPSFKHGHMSPYHLRIEYEPFQRILCLEVSPLGSFQSLLGQE